MRGQRYRLRTSTIAILHDGEGHKTIVTIPLGDIVEVAEGAIDGDRLIDVRWDGKAVMMFTQDLRDRGRKLI